MDNYFKNKNNIFLRDLKEKYRKNFAGLSEEKYINLRKALKNIQDVFIIYMYIKHVVIMKLSVNSKMVKY